MPGNEHLIFATEDQWGVWKTPASAIEVTSVGVNPAMPMMVNEDTGGGKGRRPGVPGEMTVSGPIKTHMYGKTLGLLLRGPYGARTSDAAEIIGAPAAITSISKAATAVVTCPDDHGITTTATVFIEGVTADGAPFVGGFYVGTQTGAKTFTIPVDTTDWTAGATGGTWQLVTTATGTELAIASVSEAASAVITLTPDLAAGLDTGSYVRITDSDTVPSINGIRKIIKTGAKTFTLDPAVDTTGGSAGTGVGTVASVAGFKTVLLPDDELAFDSFSLQKRYSATLAESIKGAKINGIKITARSKQFVEIELDVLAQEAIDTTQTYGTEQAIASVSKAADAIVTLTPDLAALAATGSYVRITGSDANPSVNGIRKIIKTAAKTFKLDPAFDTSAGDAGTGVGTVSLISTGATWQDGTPAPLVVDPVPYAADQPDPITFYGGVLKTGATVIQDVLTGELIAVGGEERCDFDSIELDFKFNLSNAGFGVCLGRRTVQSIDEGKREIALKIEPNFGVVEEEWYRHWITGDDVVIELFFQSTESFDPATGALFMWHWVFPLVRVKTAPNPELNAAYGLKRISVDTQPFADMSLNRLDNGLVLQSTENYAA